MEGVGWEGRVGEMRGGSFRMGIGTFFFFCGSDTRE